MRPTLLALLICAPAIAFASGGPVPTVIVNIHALGADRVEALKQAPGVAWSAEFGNEMLLGVTPESLAGWLKDERAKPGPPELAFDEVVVRDHVCTLHDHEPAIAAVGGFEIVRKSPVLVQATRGAAITGEPLPSNGVVAREVRNQRRSKGVLPPVAKVQNLLARIDANRWFDTMSDLAAFNRNTFNPGLIAAHDWVLQRFADSGLQPQSFAFNMSVTASTCSPPPAAITAYNPIGIKRGETLPDEWIVVGAHYDSRNIVRCDTTNPQPGANDNASGCAGVIELARAFAEQPTARSILFMCFSGEEQGLEGSRRYVISLQNSGEITRVKHMLNLDMIGHAIDDTLTARVETTSAQSQAGVLAMYTDAALTYAPELNLVAIAATQAYSDHWYFINAQIPAAFTWENGAGGIYPQYHSLNDLPANMLRARPLAHGILKMDAAVLADLAVLLPLFAHGFED
ncbi:MAG: M28 family peptidase [Pseudomonadota bacterium]|nr:M28 family peptidase [Pseudomonadota bacterium]